MAVSNAYEMETTDDLYAKVQNEEERVPSRHVVQANENGIYFEAQDVPTMECKYDDTIHDEDKKCNLTNSAFMLAFLSLLVAIVAVSLVYVFNIKPNNDLQNPVVTSQSHKNLVAIMEQQTNILNATLSTVQQSTVDIQREQQTTNRSLQATNGQLQILQNLINILIFNHSDTEWLTLLNGFQYRRTNQTMDRPNARKECKRLGGNLASVRISEASIRTFLLSHFLTKGNSYWIGLKDRGDDNWHWINDRKQINKSNDIWFEGEPNNAGLYGEDCAVLAVNMSVVKANDVNCGWPFYGLCEKPVAP